MYDFQSIMDYGENKKNFDLLVEQYMIGREKNDISVVPFIGAGLSAFCYPAWGGVLQQLIDEFCDKDKNELLELLEKGKFEKIADMLSKTDERKFYIKLREIYGIEKLYKYLPSLHKQAIGLMPFLFPSSLIMTSNFDPVIETVFDSVQITTPDIFHSPEILTEPNNSFKLFKIHGDIFSNNDDIIFSGKSYSRYYKPNSKLVKNLKILFKDKSMLFMGASLDKDRTLDVLKKVDGGKSHFAIIECEYDEKIYMQRRKELNFLGILPIFYPKGEYHCVYMLINELIKAINPSGFIEGRHGEKFYINDGFVTRIEPSEYEEEHSEYMQKVYKSYTPEQLNDLLQCAVISHNLYIENQDDEELSSQAAEYMLHLVRCEYLKVFITSEYFNPIDALRTLVDLSKSDYVIRLYAESLTWNENLFKLEQIRFAKEELKRLYYVYVEDNERTDSLQDVSLFYSLMISRLMGVLLWTDYQECNLYIDELKMLYQKFKNTFFALPYARGLWSIHLGELQESLSQITEKCIKAKDDLLVLLKENNYDGSLLRIYARMLINLINAQTIEDAEKTMNELFELFVQEKTDDIAVWCAQGLVSLSLKYDNDFEARSGITNALYHMSQEYSHIPVIEECFRRTCIAFKSRMDDMRNYESANYDPYDPYNFLNNNIDMANGKTINLTPWWSKDEKKLKKIKFITIGLLIVYSVAIILGIVLHISWLWISGIILAISSLITSLILYFKIFSSSIDKMFKF